MKRHRKSLTRIAALSVAGLLTALFITVRLTPVNGALASMEVIEKGLESSAKYQTMVMEVKALTNPGTDFKNLDPEASPMTMSLFFENGHKPKWMIVKGDRYLFSKGNDWVQSYNPSEDNKFTGRWEPDGSYQRAGSLINLLNPDKMFDNMSGNPKVRALGSEVSDLVGIRIEATVGEDGDPFGDFVGIEGVNLLYRYTFDKETYRIEHIYIYKDFYGNECLLETTDIKYDVPIPWPYWWDEVETPTTPIWL